MKKFTIYLTILFMLISVNYSYAGDEKRNSETGTDIATRVICNIVGTLSGSLSQGIATIVIIITGYSFFVGKVSIGMLFIVTGGIVLVFGAQTIMGWIMGTTFTCKTGNIDEFKAKG